MATLAELRTRLKSRLGLGVVSAVEQARLNEAVNSGISRALSDGAPGLATEVFTGATYGSLALTSADLTAGSSLVAVVDDTMLADHVFPGDILVFTVGGVTTKYLIREVPSEVSLDLGVEVPTTASADSASIIRRSLVLPSSGQVIRVGRISGSSVRWLEHAGSAVKANPFGTGKGAAFEQRFSEGHTKSHALVWPAPDDTTELYLVEQSEYKVQMDEDTDTLSFPEEAVDGILERSRQAYLTWIGSADGVQLGAAAQASRDVADSIHNSGNAHQLHQRY